MLMVFYVIQLIVASLLILVVMFQKSEGGSSLISTNTYNSFFSSKAMVANPLTKVTIVLGFALFLNSIIIGVIHINKRSNDDALLNKIQQIQEEKTKQNNLTKDNKVPKAPLGNK
jgi:protein translocase SecG subunit